MKRIITFLLAFLLVTGSVVMSVSAASVDLADSGKTVLTIGDWVYEKIENDNYYEIDEYIGEDTEVYVPRIVGNTMVTALGDHCFMNNSTITRVITSSPLWTVGEYAFIDCTALSYFECNYALNSIESGAFSGTTALKTINLQDSVVTEISPYTFLNSGIEEVSLPDTCTKIGNYAFGQCSLLTKITIPSSVTEIHDDAFKGTNNVVIYCYTDSYAHQYAVSKGMSYVLIDGQPVAYLLGDANGSDSIDITDATWIQRYDAEMDITPVKDTIMHGDVDGSGSPSVVDATFIMRYLVGIATPYDIGALVTRV